MCVILLSTKGATAPTEEQIRKAFAKNPDGAGFAYCDKSDHDKVKFKKGFMTVESLLEELTPLDQWTDTTLAIHFRIGTAGKNDKYTCHPFLISNKFADLRKLEGEGAVLFHNGVLDKGGLADPLSSDTQDFTIAYAPMLAKYNKSKTRDAFIESAVIGSRLLCMYDGNKIKLFGDWKKSDDGNLLVSNKLFEQNYYYSYPNPYYGTYKPYNSGWDDDDDDYYYKSKTKSGTSTTKPSLTSDEIDKAFNITSPDSKHLSACTKEEVEKAWSKLKQERYLWLDDYAMLESMLEFSDELGAGYVIRDGVTYLYDEDQMFIYEASLDGCEEY